MAPPSNCISPIGEKAILHGLYKQIKGDFYTAVTRPPAVYRGNPFIIEAGLAFGKGPEQAAADAGSASRPAGRGRAARTTTSELARVIRYANRVPCSISSRRARPSSQSSRPAGETTASRNRAGRSRRGPWWCSSTWPRSGYRSPASRRRRSPITTRSGRRSGWRCRNAGAGSAYSCESASGPRASSAGAISSSSYIEEVVEACARLKGGKLPEGKAQEPAAEDRAQAHRRGQDRRDPGPRQRP